MIHSGGGITNTEEKFSSGAFCFSKIYRQISQQCYLKKRTGIQTCSVVCHNTSRPKLQLSSLTWCYPALSFPSYPLHDVLFDQGEGLPFSDSSPSAAVAKFTSKFKWRLTLAALSPFPFQTSKLKIYSVGDKQDAAALGPWRSWKLASVFTDVL